jgi:hypothetical protein
MSRKTLNGDHMRVIAGYCQNAGAHPYWVYVFDPKIGPYAQTFDSWYGTSAGNWIGPATTGPWSPVPLPGVIPDRVRWDESGVWSDWDKDGLMDFDEIRRFGLCPFHSDYYSILSLAGSNVTQEDPCDAP